MLKTTAMGFSVEMTEQITVTYREENGFFLARALEFDIVGIGKTRETALQDLRELFAEYAEEMILSREPVQFYFPSDAEEWNNPDKEFFHVKIEATLETAANGHPPERLSTITQLRPFHFKSIKHVDLLPVCG